MTQEETADEPLSTSRILHALAHNHPGERISVQDLVDGLGERSFGFLLLLFSLPCIVSPPGIGSLPGIPLMFFGLQMLLQFRTPWLPKAISKRSIRRKDLLFVINKTTPVMRRIERWCRPRWSFIIGPTGERLLGLLIAFLAFVILLPGPGTNQLPGVAIAFMSIAIIERDGLLVFAGVAASIIAAYVAGLALWLFVTTILPSVWQWLTQFAA